MVIINHPSIIDAKPVQIQKGCHPNRIVLRHLIEESDTPYVVHRENLEIDGNFAIHRNFYHGEYFDNILEAKEYFKKA